jgi:hypothetical protein
MANAIITRFSSSEFSVADSRRTHATLTLDLAPPGEATFAATFPAAAIAAGLRVAVQRGAQSRLLCLPAPDGQSDTGTFADRLVRWRTESDRRGILTLGLRVRDLLGTASSEEWLLKLSDVPATTTVGGRAGDHCQITRVEADLLVEVLEASQALDEGEVAQLQAKAARPLLQGGCDGLAVSWAQGADDPVSAPAGPTSMGPTTLPNPAPPPSMIPACLGEAPVPLPVVHEATPLHYTCTAVAGEFSTTGTAVVTVLPVADTPTVTPFGIDGYVVSRNPADGQEVTHFKITAITGQLFLSNNVTPVNNGDFITADEEGVAGLKFQLPSPVSPRGFTAQASTSATDSGLGGSPVPVFVGTMETLFRSDFDPTPIDQPPALMQAVGTAHIHHGPGGSVLVAMHGSPPVKWVRIRKAFVDVDVTGFQGKFAQFRGESVYSALLTAF